MGLGLSLASCCPPTCSPLRVSVAGCRTFGPYDGLLGTPLPIAGATITYIQGVTTYGPFTTDAGGVASVPVFLTGSASFTVYPPAGSHYDVATFTRSLVCGPADSVGVTLSPSSGYRCAPPGCCDGGTTAEGPPYDVLEISWPTTVYLNDGFGAVALSGGGTPDGFTYTGCATRTAANVFIIDEVTCSGSTPATDYLVHVFFTVSCNSPSGAVGISVDFPRYNGAACFSGCQPPGVCAAGAPTLGQIIVGGDSGAPPCPNVACGYLSRPTASNGVAPLASCPPGSVSLSCTWGPFRSGLGCTAFGGSIDSGLENVPYQVYGGAAVSVTVSS